MNLIEQKKSKKISPRPKFYVESEITLSLSVVYIGLISFGPGPCFLAHVVSVVLGGKSPLVFRRTLS